MQFIGNHGLFGFVGELLTGGAELLIPVLVGDLDMILNGHLVVEHGLFKTRYLVGNLNPTIGSGTIPGHELVVGFTGRWQVDRHDVLIPGAIPQGGDGIIGIQHGHFDNFSHTGMWPVGRDVAVQDTTGIHVYLLPSTIGCFVGENAHDTRAAFVEDDLGKDIPEPDVVGNHLQQQLSQVIDLKEIHDFFTCIGLHLFLTGGIDGDQAGHNTFAIDGFNLKLQGCRGYGTFRYQVNDLLGEVIIRPPGRVGFAIEAFAWFGVGRLSGSCPQGTALALGA